MSIGISFLGIILIALLGACIAATVLFIVDGVMAKREMRKRRTVFTVLFIISMAIIGTFVIMYAMLSILSVLIVMNM